MIAKIAAAIVATFLFAAAAGAQEAPPPKPRTADEVRREMEALQARMEKLAQERQQAEQREEEARWLAEIQEQARQRLKEQEERLRDLANQEAPETAARKAFVAALRTHLAASREVDEKIIALKGPTAPADARPLLVRRETQDAGWDLLLAPKYERTCALEEMERHAREMDAKKALAILAKLKEAHAKDIAAGEKEFALRAERIALRQEIDELMRSFHGAIAAEMRERERTRRE